MAGSKRNKRPISGWVVFDKPYGMTSTEAVGKLRWLYQAEKAGHAGTLDPLATGILPIALGEATKTVPAVQDGIKIYRFSMRFGTETATEDAEGEVTLTSDIRPTREALEAVLPAFTGSIMQTPPAFSAIRINGERAYDLARAGEAVVMEPRPITIEKLALLEFSTDEATLEVVCQKGTYVRSLARDIARALGSAAHVSALRRTMVGAFTEDRAVGLQALESTDVPGRDAVLLPVAAGLAGLPEIWLDLRQAMLVRLGNPVLLTGAGAPIAVPEAWASLKGEAVALGEVEAGQFRPRRVILAGH